MKILRELLAVAGERAVLKRLNEKKDLSLTRTLIELVKDPDVGDDKAARVIYGPTADRKLPAYKTLKSRLREIMITAIHKSKVMDADYSNYNAAYESGYRQLYTVQILAINQAYNAAREIARHTFSRVRHYEIIPLNHALANQLAYMYLGVGYNEQLVEKYSEINRYYSEAAYVLSKLDDRYRIVRDMTYAHRKTFPEIGKIALGFAEEFRESRETYSHVSRIQGMIFNIEITGLMYSGRYQEALEASKRGESVLRKCKGVSSSVMNFLLLTRLECILKSEDFESGKAEIASAAASLPANTINGIKVVEYAIRFGLQMQEYDYAYLALANLNRRLINRLLSTRHQEYWMIWEAYVNFLVVAGKITPDENWPRLPRFKFAKFFNNVPTYSRNKTGMNIPILILQALYFIVEGKYDKVRDRTEALERYCSRYLKNDENLRNNCFFKLLLMTEQANFHKGATERKAASIYKRMISQPAKSKEEANDMEIVPYEALWEIVLENLTTERRMEVSSRQ